MNAAISVQRMGGMARRLASAYTKPRPRTQMAITTPASKPKPMPGTAMDARAGKEAPRADEFNQGTDQADQRTASSLSRKLLS